MSSRATVFPTKNGYGLMVVIFSRSAEQFGHINGGVEFGSRCGRSGKLRRRPLRHTHEEVFGPFGAGFATTRKPRRLRDLSLPLFWDDLNEAVSYIADVLKAPEAAERLIDATEAGILAHSRNPTLATTYKTAKPRPLPYYWFEVGNYMVFYVVLDDVMEVRRFLYGARDLTNMLP